MPGFELINTIKSNYSDIWAFTFVNDLLVSSNINGEVIIYDIDDLTNIKIKGRLSIFEDNAFVTQITDSKMFFTNDLSKMEVSYEYKTTPVNKIEAQYILEQNNNFKVLRDLFNIEDDVNQFQMLNSAYIPQIPEKL